MTIVDIRNGEQYDTFPIYGKHDFSGSHYGYITVTHEMKVLYFYISYSSEGDYPELMCSDVTEYFEFKNKPKNKLDDKDKLIELSSAISQIENAMERWHHARDNDDETLEEINSILSNIGLLGWFNKDKTAKNKPKKRLKWYNAEHDKPIAGQEIIFIDNVGMCKGIYHAIRDGVVYVEGKESDTIEWQDIFQWIEYPEY